MQLAVAHATAFVPSECSGVTKAINTGRVNIDRPPNGGANMPRTDEGHTDPVGICRPGLGIHVGGWDGKASMSRFIEAGLA